ncbi:MAG: GAF domain-containing protein [Alphaproteobacteria bacterium]|nr:GAF domain-containing protein [Alphaproteobacteria bacterium]
MSTIRIDPDREARRLAALRRYDILDTAPDKTLDRLTALAARRFGAPMAVISLVDESRVWFKSRHGLALEQIERTPGLCASAIEAGGPWVLTDARSDPRSLAHPLVAGEFGLRFYAGVPLSTDDGHALGMLCVIDREPREPDPEAMDDLADLATVIMGHMELQLSARRAAAELSGAVAERQAAIERYETLRQETDHRVMNSLQLVAGLLKLQGREASSAEASSALELAASRIISVARVHRHLYTSRSGDVVDCRDYLGRLCANLDHSLGNAGSLSLTVQAPHLALPVARMVPLGLIVNEFVTNAVKNGGRTVSISLGSAGEDALELSVADDGPGLPAEFGLPPSLGLGMKVVDALVRQLGGQLAFGRDDLLGGARLSVIFQP